jgi:hypothetical protein
MCLERVSPFQSRVQLLLDPDLFTLELPDGRILRLGLVPPQPPRKHGGLESAPSSALPVGAGSSYLAPGVPIACDGQRIGLGAVLSDGGDPVIITCGHAVTSSSLTRFDDEDDEIGTLLEDFFHSNDRLDAAAFTVTPRGLELLQAGSAAETWCTAIHDPVDGDRDVEVIFYPTYDDYIDPIRSSVDIPGTVDGGLIMLPRITTLSDSGSTLQLGGQYYGLASQRTPGNSYFTPIAAVRARLGNFDPWSPS